MPSHLLNTSLIADKNADIVAVKHYYYGLQRFNCLLIGLALLAALIGNYLFGQFSEYVSNTLNYETDIKKQYDRLVRIYAYDGDVYDRSYEDFFKGQFNFAYKNDLIFIAISHTIWLVPLLFLLFWRAPPPVVFDGGRQLIYTIRWGKFYSASFDQLKPRFPKGHYLHLRQEKGPLEISLFDQQGKEKRFRLGAYFSYPHQSSDLYQWFKEYMASKADASSFKERKDSWIEKCLFPPRKLPEEKINRILEAIK